MRQPALEQTSTVVGSGQSSQLLRGAVNRNRIWCQEAVLLGEADGSYTTVSQESFEIPSIAFTSRSFGSLDVCDGGQAAVGTFLFSGACVIGFVKTS